jgi:hypothetical protein
VAWIELGAAFQPNRGLAHAGRVNEPIVPKAAGKLQLGLSDQSCERGKDNTMLFLSSSFRYSLTIYDCYR